MKDAMVRRKNKSQDVDAVVHFPHRDGGLYGNDRFYDVAMDGAAGGSGQKHIRQIAEVQSLQVSKLDSP
jgi:hypothetical protein